jgi:hypothetical protein
LELTNRDAYEHVIEELVDAEDFMYPWFQNGGDNVTFVYEDGTLVDMYQLQPADGVEVKALKGAGLARPPHVVKPNEDGTFGFSKEELMRQISAQDSAGFLPSSMSMFHEEEDAARAREEEAIAVALAAAAAADAEAPGQAFGGGIDESAFGGFGGFDDLFGMSAAQGPGISAEDVANTMLSFGDLGAEEDFAAALLSESGFGGGAGGADEMDGARSGDVQMMEDDSGDAGESAADVAVLEQDEEYVKLNKDLGAAEEAVAACQESVELNRKRFAEASNEKLMQRWQQMLAKSETELQSAEANRAERKSALMTVRNRILDSQ